MRHKKYDYVKQLIELDEPVLLVGESGSGKTTMIQQISEELNLPFYPISLTRQTTLSWLLGFRNVNGVYVPSLLREAVEHGGILLLDEMNAADPNVLIALNTLENGFITFPDKTVEKHPDFRIVGTANPLDDIQRYTGRAKLDESILDRFEHVYIEADEDLEKELLSKPIRNFTKKLIDDLKRSQHFRDMNISMREKLRFEKRYKADLLVEYLYNKFDVDPQFRNYVIELWNTIPKMETPEECTSLHDLIQLYR